MKRLALQFIVALGILAIAAYVLADGPQPSVGLYWYDSKDPTANPGMSAPLNQLLIRTDLPSIYYKSGSSNTSWTKIGSVSSGGTVTSVSCGTGLTCAPNPITTTGTASITNTAVSPGSYTNASFTVNAQGQLTAASSGTAPVTGSGTTNTVAKFTSSSAVGNSSITDDGTNVATSEFAQFNKAVGTINTTAGVYVAGTLGVGWPTPGTFVDIRHNFISGWDDFEIVEASPNTNNGVEIDYVRSYGSINAPTSTDITTTLVTESVWGYNTNNTVSQGGQIRWLVDQHNTATAVPSAMQIRNVDSGGVLRNNFSFDSAGHFAVTQVTAPALTSCGTGATISGSDQGGTVSVGTGATGCTITFHQSWSTTFNAPNVHCTVTSQSGQLFTYTMSQTAITITQIGPISSTNIDYTCVAAGPPST